MSTFEPLPHAYPFRLADRTVERRAAGCGTVRAVVSAGGRLSREGPLSAGCVGELMAQSALLLSGTDADLGKSGFLAGLSDVVVVRPPEIGDALTVSVSVAGRTGAVVKFDTSIVDGDGALVARGAVTVREGRATPGGPA